MAKYAKGKKSYAISDRSGLRVRYTQLKTTWDGLRVSPEDWEPKQPQLTPAKNVVDATALFNGRPDTDPENVAVYIGYTQDWTIDPRSRPSVGVNAPANVGYAYLEITHETQTGVVGTSNVGDAVATTQIEILPNGQAGTGAVGDAALLVAVTGVGGNGGTGGIGAEALDISLEETGVGGTASVGTEIPIVILSQDGLGSSGGVGDTDQLTQATVAGVDGDGDIGSHVPQLFIYEVGLGSVANVGDVTVLVDYNGFGSNPFGEGTWGQ